MYDILNKGPQFINYVHIEWEKLWLPVKIFP